MREASHRRAGRAVTALLIAGLLHLLHMPAVQSAEIPLPERNPLSVLKPAIAGVEASGTTVPLPERRPGVELLKKAGKLEADLEPIEKEPEPPPSWSPAEVAAAKAECETLTKGLDAEIVYLEPVKLGQCGTPQPVEVKSLGSGQQVLLVPPAVMNCRMVAMLSRWIDTVVQPKARALLGKPIARLTNASAYVCRNRYGAKDQKLSEHAKANAFDVSAFVTSDGRSISVEANWGPTMAEIEARQAVEAEKLAKAEADKAMATKVASTGGALPASVEAAAEAPAKTAAIVPPPPKKIKNGKGAKSAGQTLSLGELVKGEPLVAKGSTTDRKRNRGELFVRPPELMPKSPEGKFLHAVHAAACLTFGTVLGPEANAAHHDHLHLDLATRRKSNFCQ
jgi:hypothetical protein